MKDLLGLMGKAKEMQAKMQSMQEDIATLEVMHHCSIMPTSLGRPSEQMETIVG